MSDIKIMFAGDLHKRSKDITTIEGYVKCNVAVQRSLMQDIREMGIDYFVSLGDWYDKGYVSDVAASLADYDMDVEMSKLLNGKFYGLIGNHIRLNMDSNPELHIIQPHPLYTSRHAVTRTEQIMKTPEILRIRDVQISFMHHNKDAEDVSAYKPVRQSWAKYHIALFHTPYIVPNAKLVDTNYGYNTASNSKIGKVLEGVDLAIVGDIHNPLGQFPVNTEYCSTTMIVPGSLTNTDASERNRHTEIAAPIITIDDESNVKLSYKIVNLKTNLLTFKQKNLEKSKEKLKSIRGKATTGMLDSVEAVSIMSDRDVTITSLNAFMTSVGFSDVDKQIIKSIINEPNRLDKLLHIYVNR